MGHTLNCAGGRWQTCLTATPCPSPESTTAAAGPGHPASVPHSPGRGGKQGLLGICSLVSGCCGLSLDSRHLLIPLRVAVALSTVPSLRTHTIVCDRPLPKVLGTDGQGISRRLQSIATRLAGHNFKQILTLPRSHQTRPASALHRS